MSKTSESAFLAQQAVDAKAALTRALSEIGKGFGESANVAAWTRQYPWLTLGASSVAGFVATAMLVPSKEDQALKRLARIERALHPAPPQQPAAAPQDGAQQYKAGHRSLTQSIFGEVIKAVQPALLSMLTAGVTAKAARPSQEEMQAAAAAEDQSAGSPAHSEQV